MPGRRFFLPDGYSLATKGRLVRWTKPGFASEPTDDPEAAAEAAWDDAGETPPQPVYEDLP